MTTQDNTPEHQSSFVSYEHEILAYWKQERIFARSQEYRKDAEKYWYIDGPPFATGLPHHGHLLASTIKDVVPRYYEMQGFCVPRSLGWDCHGLPIEHEIDKSLGMSASDAVAKLGLAAYNQECRSIVHRYTKEWEKTLTRIGRWLDFDNPYRTMDPEFMESVWWALGRLWDQHLLYPGVKVVPYSTQLQTGLSNFEASSNYQSVQSPAITVLLKLKHEDAYLAIWTTTPWTLPTNTAVCIGPYDYLKVYDASIKKHIIVAKDALTRLHNHKTLTIVASLSYTELEGKHYEPLFSFINTHEKAACSVLVDDYVTTSDGTGLVHMAPAHGEDDYRVCQKHGLEPVCLLDAKGCFEAELESIGGLYFKDANKWIIASLKDRGLLLHHETLEHNYPFCPRSDTPLIYRTIPSWYVKVDPLKRKLLDANDTIRWVPGHIQHGRFGKWLEGAKDWAISRNRYWGTPIPIWINDVTGTTVCIDSRAKLAQLTGYDGCDLHPEHVNTLTFTKPDEKGTYRRIPDVLDCWFESGCVPFAQFHYPFANKQHFHDLFPAAFISEGIDQTRGWFYTLSILSMALFETAAFKNVIVSGIVMAEDGKKMSKRLKNYTAPDLLMDTYGADALRLYLLQSNLVRAEEMRFSDNGVKEMTRRVQLPWWNAVRFFTTYAEIDAWKAPEELPKQNNILDRWIISRLQSFIQAVQHAMKLYELHTLVHHATTFLEDLTNTYIRLNRTRFWQSEMPADKYACYATLHHVLWNFSTAMAPFAPFLSEKITQSLRPFATSETLPSVHMHNYPKVFAHCIDQELEAAVARMQQVFILGRQVRNDARIKIKTPLNSLTLIHAHTAVLSDIRPLTGYIKEELNVKTVCFSDNEAEFIELSALLNTKKLGKILGPKTKDLNHAVRALSPESIRTFENTGTLTLQGVELKEDDILVLRSAKQDSGAVSNQAITLMLDLTLTADLVDEGHARELVSIIQNARKQQAFSVTDRIRITWYANAELKRVLQQFQEHLRNETLCTSWHLELYDREQQNHSEEVTPVQLDTLQGYFTLHKAS